MGFQKPKEPEQTDSAGIDLSPKRSSARDHPLHSEDTRRNGWFVRSSLKLSAFTFDCLSSLRKEVQSVWLHTYERSASIVCRLIFFACLM